MAGARGLPGMPSGLPRASFCYVTRLTHSTQPTHSTTRLTRPVVHSERTTTCPSNSLDCIDSVTASAQLPASGPHEACNLSTNALNPGFFSLRGPPAAWVKKRVCGAPRPPWDAFWPSQGFFFLRHSTHSLDSLDSLDHSTHSTHSLDSLDHSTHSARCSF